MSLSVVCTAANTFFNFRTPAPYISPFIVQILAYPIGSFFAWAIPLWSFTLPRWLGGKEVHLNPGPFNIKEHSIIIIMASVGIGPAYGLFAVVSSELWYGHDFGPGFNILFILATQLTGFAFAGLCRRFVVWPASMIWPSVLVAATNLNTFHAEDEGFQGGMSRLKFLMITGSCAFAYYFLPGELAVLSRTVQKLMYRILVHCAFLLFLRLLDRAK
jgi:OPT family oligopeptide transporter